MKLNWQQALGLSQEHLSPLKLVNENNNDHFILKSIEKDFNALTKQAMLDGVEITVVSSFRNFEQQLTIWNDKWRGYRPVYSKQGRPLNISMMSNIEKYKAISLWSALPGLSRHHWGTDFDIFSSEAISTGHQVELVPSEFSSFGVCNQLNCWLNENLESFGFFRPYKKYNGGVSEEPWHISHIESSHSILNAYDFNAVSEYLEESNICERRFIVEHLTHYKDKYFLNVCEPVVS